MKSLRDQLTFFDLDSDSGTKSQGFLFPELAPPPTVPEDGTATVPQLIELYLHHIAGLVDAGKYSPKGLVDLRRDLRRFGCFIGDRPPTVCRHSDLFPFLASNPRWQSPSTKQRVIAYVVAFFHWLERDDRVSKNPYRRPNMRFHAKGRMRDYLERIPVWLVRRTGTGLLGAARYRLTGNA